MATARSPALPEPSEAPPGPIFLGQPLIDGEPGPLYRRLQAIIRRAIADGRLMGGDALPAEREIATALGISRVTVRKALAELVQTGVLQQRRGSGTFVAPDLERVQQPLSRLTSFTDDMRARGQVPSSRWLNRMLAPASPAEAMALGLSPGERVMRLDRLRLADGVPMAVDRAVVPASALADPQALDGSLYDALVLAGRGPVRALQRLRATTLDAAEAALLEVAPGAAAVSLERIAYAADGRAVEFTRSSYRGDAYDFVAELHLSEGSDP